MPHQVVIDNPILNSPYKEPARHFLFSDEGITDETVETRRVSSYFIPIPAAKKKGKQLTFDTEWTRERVKENQFINQVRARASQWRHGGECHQDGSLQSTTTAALTGLPPTQHNGAEEGKP